MAKMTLDEKIIKTQDEIAKTKAIIAAQQEKLKTLNATLKGYLKEKDQNFAHEIIEIMSQGVSLTNEQRDAILTSLKANVSAVLPQSEEATEAAEPTTAASETGATYGTFGTNHG